MRLGEQQMVSIDVVLIGQKMVCCTVMYEISLVVVGRNTLGNPHRHPTIE